MVVVAEGLDDCQVLVDPHKQGGEQREGGDGLADHLGHQALLLVEAGAGQVQGNQGEEEQGGGKVDHKQVHHKPIRCGAEAALPEEHHQQAEVHGHRSQEEDGKQDEQQADEGILSKQRRPHALTQVISQVCPPPHFGNLRGKGSSLLGSRRPTG